VDQTWLNCLFRYFLADLYNIILQKKKRCSSDANIWCYVELFLHCHVYLLFVSLLTMVKWIRYKKICLSLHYYHRNGFQQFMFIYRCNTLDYFINISLLHQYWQSIQNSKKHIRRYKLGLHHHYRRLIMTKQISCKLSRKCFLLLCV